MGLDHSGLMVNVVYVEKFKLKTMRNILAKYSSDKKPLFVTNRFDGRLYLDGNEVASVSRNPQKRFSPSPSQGFTIGNNRFCHPRQTMEAIEGFEAICPAFATWLIFNLDSLFAPLTP